jgi:hypothetical protein
MLASGSGDAATTAGNLPMDLYPAPALINPGNGYTTGDGRASFSWAWAQALGADECFELAMSGSLAGPFWGAVSCQKETEISFSVADAKHIVPGPGGEYFWTVRVNRKLANDQWITVSATADPRELRRSGGGGGSGGSGGKSGPPPP